MASGHDLLLSSTLAALHLATYVLARCALGAIELVTADERLLRAAETSDP